MEFLLRRSCLNRVLRRNQNQTKNVRVFAGLSPIANSKHFRSELVARCSFASVQLIDEYCCMSILKETDCKGKPAVRAKLDMNRLILVQGSLLSMMAVGDAKFNFKFSRRLRVKALDGRY